MVRSEHNMYQVQIDDLILSVDEETAKMLQDPAYASRYIQTIKQHLKRKENENRNPPETEESTEAETVETLEEPLCADGHVNKQHMNPKPSNIAETSKSSGIGSELWKSPKCPSKKDHEATLALLSLREQYKTEFDDKTTHKNEIWLKIAQTLNSMGFYVGDGLAGREKVRQKFSNLQTTYVKYCDSRKRTGEGELKRPKYFDELNSILGEKHKINPVLVIDSIEPNTSRINTNKTIETDVPSTNSTAPLSANPEEKKHRFDNVKKSVKPKHPKRAALEELLALEKEIQTTRKEEFQTLISLFREDSERRYKEVMVLLKQQQTHHKKRKSSNHSSSSESDT